MKNKIISSLIIFVFLLGYTELSFATSTSDLKNQQTQIQQDIKETENELKQVKTEISDTMQEIQKLDSQIISSEQEISKLEDSITSLQKEIDENKKLLEETQTSYDSNQKMLEERLVTQYKAGKTSYLDVLLKSKGLSDFLSKYYIMSKITENDTKLLQQIQEEKEKIEQAKANLEQKEAEYKQAKASKEKAAVVLKNSKSTKNSYVAQLSDDEKKLQEQIDAKNEELEKVSKQIKQIEQSAIIQNADYNKYVGGTMAWPTRITKRINSIYAPGGRFDTSGYAGTAHKGVDINAPAGTPIYAAADGVVVYVNSSGYGGGWGLYVVISHGNGIYTRYAHASSIAANISVGTTVTTDTVIMYSGATGAAEGAHLHFEVCQGSIYNQVNPCPYLGISNTAGTV